MPDLPFQIERYIVKQLACDVSPETIVEEVERTFLREVSLQTVQAYDPEIGEAEWTGGLSDLYARTRQQYRSASTEEERDRSFVEVATTDVFTDRSLHCVEKKGTELVIVASDGQYTALENRCSHQGGPLCEGGLEDGTVECPWHGARFDVETGTAEQAPATDAVSTYDVRVQDNSIEVKL